jgi:metallo-beta-lactamase family protein
MKITFLGATGTVTGSKYLVTSGSKRILIDCGLFQGLKELRLRNWAPLPVRPQDVDAVVLTHAHLDHSGYLPLLIKHGFGGRIFCSSATRDLCAVLLPDSGHLQEEDAAYANRKRYSKHHPAEPLYTQQDAEAALARFSPIEWEREHSLGDGLSVRLSPAGHILGSALVLVKDRDTSVLFSGDLGRLNDPVMVRPSQIRAADHLVIESTYGDRLHDAVDPGEELAKIISRTVSRGGVVIVPAFAVGRAQTLLYYVQKLKAAGAIPDVPVFLNSPMATNVTELFCRHRSEHRLDPETCSATCHAAIGVRTATDSRELDARRGPMIIISASGMLTGGRVLHHVRTFGPDPKNTIILVGYQAAGTRGASLAQGSRRLRIHGEDIDVRAEIATLHNLSAHADAAEIITWLRGFETPPITTFITHGEPSASQSLKHRIEAELGFRCRVPTYLETATLEAGARAEDPAPPPRPEPRAEAAPGHIDGCDACHETGAVPDP